MSVQWIGAWTCIKCNKPPIAGTPNIHVAGFFIGCLECRKCFIGKDMGVEWYPELCIHCQECITGLPQVFNLDARPWVNINGATSQEIKDQVSKCPSQALRLKECTNTDS